MTYEDIVFAWNANAPDDHQYDTLSDRERIEFALSLAGEVEKQESVAYLFRDMNSGGRNGCLKVCHITPCDGAFPVFTAPQQVEKQKPVAYRTETRYAQPFYMYCDSDMPPARGEWEPLYTVPQPCPECEKLKAAGKVGKREPVLTDARIEEIWYQNPCSIPFAHAIENEVMRRYPTPQPAVLAAEYTRGRNDGWEAAKLAPHPCPECEERKTTALNYISLTFEFEQLQAECEKLKAELERERMRLAACGVVAMSNTEESAKQARQMHPDYESASCADVARAVDSEIQLRKERDELAAQVEKMREFLQFLWRDAPLNEYTFARLEEMIALPDLSTSIINRVRAEALRKAAGIFESRAIGSANMSSIRALAADMEAGKC